MLACCLLPSASLNTFYVWPKMMAVGYLMLVFALLFCFRPAGEFERKLAGSLLGAAAALAILSHGTSFFALIGFGAVALVARPWPLWQPALRGLAVLAAIYAPWIVYQNVLDPPGNRLLKWHLAGVERMDARGFVATLRESYAALSWHDYLLGRFENVKALIGPWPRHLRDILALVLKQGMAVTLTGTAFGLAGAAGVTRLFKSQLVGVSATDGVSFAGTTAILVLVALAATYFPARRASGIDPMTALRNE
jgi:hypothetical protein